MSKARITPDCSFVDTLSSTVPPTITYLRVTTTGEVE
jgi:hypothetical protein